MASNLCPLQPSWLSPLHCLKLVNYNLRCACPPCSLAISASFDNTLWLGLVPLSSLSSHSLKWRLSEFIQLLYQHYSLISTKPNHIGRLPSWYGANGSIPLFIRQSIKCLMRLYERIGLRAHSLKTRADIAQSTALGPPNSVSGLVTMAPLY